MRPRTKSRGQVGIARRLAARLHGMALGLDKAPTPQADSAMLEPSATPTPPSTRTMDGDRDAAEIEEPPTMINLPREPSRKVDKSLPSRVVPYGANLAKLSTQYSLARISVCDSAQLRRSQGCCANSETSLTPHGLQFSLFSSARAEESLHSQGIIIVLCIPLFGTGSSSGVVDLLSYVAPFTRGLPSIARTSLEACPDAVKRCRESSNAPLSMRLVVVVLLGKVLLLRGFRHGPELECLQLCPFSMLSLIFRASP